MNWNIKKVENSTLDEQKKKKNEIRNKVYIKNEKIFLNFL